MYNTPYILQAVSDNVRTLGLRLFVYPFCIVCSLTRCKIAWCMINSVEGTFLPLDLMWKWLRCGVVFPKHSGTEDKDD